MTNFTQTTDPWKKLIVIRRAGTHVAFMDFHEFFERGQVEAALAEERRQYQTQIEALKAENEQLNAELIDWKKTNGRTIT
jgi:cell division protein FtsB